jgi:transposase-like protein
VYIVLAIDLEGQRHVLGHWVGDGAEGANFWLSVVTDLQTRGVADILSACVDGLTGFKEAIQAVSRAPSCSAAWCTRCGRA